MKPEFSLAPLWRIGVWLVGFLVVVQLVATMVGMLLSDWRTYVAPRTSPVKICSAWSAGFGVPLALIRPWLSGVPTLSDHLAPMVDQ